MVLMGNCHCMLSILWHRALRYSPPPTATLLGCGLPLRSLLQPHAQGMGMLPKRSLHQTIEFPYLCTTFGAVVQWIE